MTYFSAYNQNRDDELEESYDEEPLVEKEENDDLEDDSDEDEE